MVNPDIVGVLDGDCVAADNFRDGDIADYDVVLLFYGESKTTEL